MRTLNLLFDMPAEFQYAASGAGEVLASPSTQYGVLEGHQPRRGDVTWSNLPPIEFDYLMAFWRTGVREGALNFLINLPIQGGEVDVEHLARFIGGLTIGEVSGGAASISGELSIIPRSAIYPLSAARNNLLGEIASDV